MQTELTFELKLRKLPKNESYHAELIIPGKTLEQFWLSRDETVTINCQYQKHKTK